MFNLLPCDKLLDNSKFKEFADNKSNKTQKIDLFSPKKVENIADKGEDAGHQHFLFFSHCFQVLSFPRWLHFGIM